jgi:NADH-quinone oxidoreductase subunit N
MNSSIDFVIPELILVAGALLVLIGGVFSVRRQVLEAVALLAVVLGFLSLPLAGHGLPALFSGFLINDAFTFMMRCFVFLVAGFAVLMSMGYAWPDRDDRGEYYFLLLTAVVALSLAMSAGNLFMIYLAVETLSIVSYILAAYFRKDLFSTEAGLKYFLFGALSTGLMLYGISLVYGLLGTLDLGVIAAKLSAGAFDAPAFILAAVMVFAGLAFKASIVPFHMWVADVYEGAPWPVAAFFAVGPKALGFALMVKIFFATPLFIASGWAPLVMVLAILTMSIGNLSAFHQTSVKRMLALSSVAQAGYILAGLAAGVLGIKAAFFYIVIYTFMNMGAFACAACLSTERAELDSFKGMGQRAPLMAAVFAVFLLSLAGLPPLAGFLAKFFVLWSAIEARYYFLAAAVMLNSLVAFFYYLKVIRAMYFDAPSSLDPVPLSFSSRLLLMACLAAVLILGIWPQPVLSLFSSILP